MVYHTYDRLQGAWWGAIVAQRLTSQATVIAELSNFYCQPWLVQRRQLATMLLESLPSTATPYSANLAGDRPHILSLLPLILFSPEPLTKNLVAIFLSNEKVNPKVTTTEPNFIAWEYLVTTVLNQQSSASLSQLSKLVWQDESTRAKPLNRQLKLAQKLMMQGASLNLAIEQLSTSANLLTSAIALSWYCFITTPQDFYLSVRRAAIVPENLASLTVALTGTLSGAYNGMAEISRTWRAEPENTYEQVEQHLWSKLLAQWLGIYAAQHQPTYFNPNLDAVAMPQIIQPRLSLKIISQISNLK